MLKALRLFRYHPQKYKNITLHPDARYIDDRGLASVHHHVTPEAHRQYKQLVPAWLSLREHIHPDKVYLLVGRVNSPAHKYLIAEHQQNLVTVDQLCTSFPELVPLSSHRSALDSKHMKEALSKRNLRGWNNNYPLQISGILVTDNIVEMWDESIQVILDYLSTEDGRISHVLTQRVDQHVPIHTAIYQEPMEVALLGVRHFMSALDKVHRTIYNRPLKNVVNHSLTDTLSTLLKNQKTIYDEIQIESGLLGITKAEQIIATIQGTVGIKKCKIFQS